MKRMTLSHIQVAYTGCGVYRDSGRGSGEFDNLQEIVVHLALLRRVCVVPIFEMVSGLAEWRERSRVHAPAMLEDAHEGYEQCLGKG